MGKYFKQKLIAVIVGCIVIGVTVFIEVHKEPLRKKSVRSVRSEAGRNSSLIPSANRVDSQACDFLSTSASGKCEQNACSAVTPSGLNVGTILPFYNKMCSNPMTRCSYVNPTRSSNSLIPDTAELICVGGPTNGKGYRAKVTPSNFAFAYDRSTDELVPVATNCVEEKCACVTDADAIRVGGVKCVDGIVQGPVKAQQCDGSTCFEGCQCAVGDYCSAGYCTPMKTFMDHSSWSVAGYPIVTITNHGRQVGNMEIVYATATPLNQEDSFKLTLLDRAHRVVATTGAKWDNKTGVATFTESLIGIVRPQSDVLTLVPNRAENSYDFAINGVSQQGFGIKLVAI